MARDRKPAAQLKMERLERLHVQLSTLVQRLESRPFLSTDDQLQVTYLKKEKLAAKDAMMGLRRGH